MSLRPEPTDPADMTPEQRLDEVASMLARGILRLHGRILPDTRLLGPEAGGGGAGAFGSASASQTSAPCTPRGLALCVGVDSSVKRTVCVSRFPLSTRASGRDGYGSATNPGVREAMSMKA
ncbi:MAG: hypothetical protein JNL80_10660 [Phycisphaerae bacterium]|jgi:hypothetical protein|nr:hypothetical protein [Phycisphaerae bacterium]